MTGAGRPQWVEGEGMRVVCSRSCSGARRGERGAGRGLAGNMAMAGAGGRWRPAGETVELMGRGCGSGRGEHLPQARSHLLLARR